METRLNCELAGGRVCGKCGGQTARAASGRQQNETERKANYRCRAPTSAMMRPGQPQLLQRHAALMQDLLLWRFIGAAIWGQALLAAVHLASAVLLKLIGRSSPFALLGWRGLLLHALQFAVLLAHRRVLSAAESAPAQIPKLRLFSWISIPISRVLLRERKLQDIISVLYLYGTTAACATAYAYLNPSLATHATSLQWSACYGCAMAACYATQHLARCRDVLAYPALQRHRYFQIKSRAPQIAKSAARVGAVALLLALLARQAPVPGLLQLLSTFLSMALCALGWLLGQAMLDIVFSEQLRLLQHVEAPFDALVSFGLSSSSTLVQDLTLMDLALVAEESSSGGKAARQAVAFADENGRLGWTPLGGLLIGELRDLTTILAAALPSPTCDGSAASGVQAAPGKALSHVQWNAVSSPSVATRPPENRRGQELAAWAVRSRFYRAGWCLRILSALTAASRTEDRFGVLLLCEPNLADVVAALASTVLVLQQYMKYRVRQYTKYRTSLTAASSGPVKKASAALLQLLCLPEHPTGRKVEELAFILEDLARSCMYRVTLAFGASLKAALKEGKQKPAYGSVAEVSSLLQCMLDMTE